MHRARLFTSPRCIVVYELHLVHRRHQLPHSILTTQFHETAQSARPSRWIVELGHKPMGRGSGCHNEGFTRVAIRLLEFGIREEMPGNVQLLTIFDPLQPAIDPQTAQP
jgi:hypothetical protein